MMGRAVLSASDAPPAGQQYNRICQRIKPASMHEQHRAINLSFAGLTIGLS